MRAEEGWKTNGSKANLGDNKDKEIAGLEAGEAGIIQKTDSQQVHKTTPI